MLVSLLPGLRELHAPLAAGYLWLLSAYLLAAPHVPDRDEAEGIVEDLYSLEGVATALGIGIAASFVAYLVGTLSSGFLNPLLREAVPRLPELLGRGRRARPVRLSERSWIALRDLVLDALRKVDAAVAESPITLARLVRDEVPARGGGDERRSLVERALAAVADELDLVKTRLLGKEADLFSTVDRHQAEADFRLAVLPPLAVLAVVVTAAAGLSWVGLVAVLVAVPVIGGLGRQAFASDRAAAEVLVDALRLERVASPTLERLEAAARRTAGVGADDPLPALRTRAEAVDATVGELRTAVSWLRPLEGRHLTDEVRQHARVAGDGLERLDVYLPHATGLQERTRRIRELLGGDGLARPQLDELEESIEAISELSLSAIESPGELEDLVADEEKLRAALAGGDRERQRLAHYALVDAVAATPDLPRLLEAAASAARDAERASPQLRRAVENAARRDSSAVTVVSWQGAHLPGVDLAGLALPGIDLRDADLTKAVLVGCDLHSASLHNATLVGSELENANLTHASFEYTDLADADLRGADLSFSTIKSPLVQGLKLSGVQLVNADYDAGDIPWHLIDRWSEATLDADDRAVAVEIGGSPPEGPRVLMLSWEAPPLVAGGSWTACWHLVRSVRARGADITVVVPWAESLCDARPFGLDVEVVFAGIEPTVPTPYVAAGGPFPPYLPYSAFSPYWWEAGAPSTPPSAYGVVARRAVDDFAAWLSSWSRLSEFALVHAHDWVTFPAAERAAGRTGRPWVAHVHSTASDRRPDSIDLLGTDMERLIERAAVQAADVVVAPSRVTAETIRTEYDTSDIRVIPNPLAREAPPPRQVGDLDAKRVVFVGRLAAQKGPDRFIEVARRLRASGRAGGEWPFVLFGDGEERPRLEAEARGAVTFAGAVPWAERERAFAGASLLLVPSRSEPFGMVVAEAMQRRVPAVYAEEAGIREAVAAGVAVDAADVETMAAEVEAILTDPIRWDDVAERQLESITAYRESRPEARFRGLWATLERSREAPRPRRRRARARR